MSSAFCRMAVSCRSSTEATTPPPPPRNDSRATPRLTRPSFIPQRLPGQPCPTFRDRQYNYPHCARQSENKWLSPRDPLLRDTVCHGHPVLTAAVSGIAHEIQL